MLHANFFATSFGGHESVTFSRTSDRNAATVRVPGSSIMIGLIRAAALCATLALGLVTAQAADKAFKRDDLQDFGGQAGGPDQERSRRGGEIQRDAENRCRRRLQAQRFPHRPADPRADRGHDARRQRQLAAAGPRHFPDLAEEFQRGDLPAGARLDRGLHRLPARRQCRRRGGRAGRARPRDVRPQAVASGAGQPAAVARHARGRRGARPIREAARRAWLPAARLHR